ncbi:glycerophosphodiester phosphodiesterase [Flavivirga aquatica]|uniref:Glycerophosphodiester phosphodiesterase n=1 Tax=Flavivirga aquatica TaxID=1849968 RepID=A0A1E5T8W5_9FLAO|nr:glycerophosphodiester phosphodiesterase family protein [Flavivirga aquatica]OEK07820.1 glycerophosphodiester phosphodiesterase [Flavivirga aquatica]
MNRNCLSIGHRGAKGHITENTLESIQWALDFGVDGIEIDVHLCASGELVVFHDFTLDRITNGTGEISKKTLTELKKIKVEDKYSIPTLEEVLNVVNRKCFINIELKGEETFKEICRIIDRYVAEKGWKYQDFIVSSFQEALLLSVYNINKKVPLGVLTDINLEQSAVFGKTINAIAIHPDYTMLTKENIAKLKQGYKVFTWTVNNKQTIERVKSYGVDGIISDFPDSI